MTKDDTNYTTSKNRPAESEYGPNDPTLPLTADIAVESRFGGGPPRHVYYASVGGTARSAGRMIVVEPEGPWVRYVSMATFAARYVPLSQCPPGVREKCRGILDYAAWLRTRALTQSTPCHDEKKKRGFPW